MHRGVPALALRTPLMATTLVSVETREVVRCVSPTASWFSSGRQLPLQKVPQAPGYRGAGPAWPIPVEPSPCRSRGRSWAEVAGQVKEIRRARHLSQRQLAGRMQVPRTYISKIENGKAIPTLGSLERLADALGVDVRQLVRDARSLPRRGSGVDPGRSVAGRDCGSAAQPGPAAPLALYRRRATWPWAAGASRRAKPAVPVAFCFPVCGLMAAGSPPGSCGTRAFCPGCSRQLRPMGACATVDNETPRLAAPEDCVPARKFECIC
jgi:transcriptional regulator with XRE-family HTH domain